MGSDLTTVNAARVSFGKESEYDSEILSWTEYEDNANYDDYFIHETFYEPYTGVEVRKLKDKDVKLIKYLAKHKHLSPFGHAFASFHVKAPIFVARQLVKHKFLRWNEISRRYVDDEPEFYVPDVWRGRSDDKKQGSSDAAISMLCMGEDGEQERGLPKLSHSSGRVRHSAGVAYSQILELYQEMLKSGIAPEQARMVLPQSTMTEWYWSGSLDAFAAMCKLRCASDSQYESRVVADQISEVMSGLYPVSWSAVMEEIND